MNELLLEVQIPNLGEVFMRYWRAFVLMVPKLILGVIIITIAVFIAIQLSRLINNHLRIKAADPLLISFIAQIAKWVLILAGITLGFSAIGFSNLVGGLIASAGVSALVIGFAFKDIGENFLAGIILAFNRPFHVTDVIGVSGFMGEVIAMGLRSTQIRTFDGQDVYIPNSVIMKGNLANFTAHGNVRLDFKLYLDLNTDTEAASAVILGAIQNIEGVLEKEGPFCAIEEFTTSNVVLRVYFWAHTFNYKTETLFLKTKAMETALRALKEAGFGVIGLPKAE